MPNGLYNVLIRIQCVNCCILKTLMKKWWYALVLKQEEISCHKSNRDFSSNVVHILVICSEKQKCIRETYNFLHQWNEKKKLYKVQIIKQYIIIVPEDI